MRPTLCIVAVLFGSSFAAPLSLWAQEKAKQPSAEAILSRVREHYASLKDYHFEHQINATLERPDKEAIVLATVDFDLSVAGAERFDHEAKSSAFPTSMERCRMSARSEANSMVLVSDGEEAVFYVPNLKQFKRAPSAMRAIGGPTSATFFFLVNNFATAIFVDAPFQGARLLRQESHMVGDREVNCHVIEAQIHRKPLDPDAGAPGKGEGTAFLAGSGYLMFLGTHGLTSKEATPRGISRADADAGPITMLLWVDHTEPIVWKSELREPLTATDGDKAKPTLLITDTYSRIKTKGPLPEELFRFEIVEGTREVEKIGQP